MARGVLRMPASMSAGYCCRVDLESLCPCSGLAVVGVLQNTANCAADIRRELKVHEVELSTTTDIEEPSVRTLPSQLKDL